MPVIVYGLAGMGMIERLEVKEKKIERGLLEVPGNTP